METAQEEANKILKDWIDTLPDCGTKNIWLTELSLCGSSVASNRWAMELAAKTSNVAMVKLILSLGTPKEYGGNSLLYACQLGCTEVVKLLLPVSKKIPNAFYSASRNGHTEIVKMLLKCKNASENYGSMLSSATVAGHTDVIKLLFSVCGKAIIQDALFHAVLSKKVEVLDLFIPQCVNKTNINDVLTTAAEIGCVEMCERLLPLTTSKTQINNALFAAVEERRANVIDFLATKSNCSVVYARCLKKNVDAKLLIPHLIQEENMEQRKKIGKELQSIKKQKVLSSPKRKM